MNEINLNLTPQEFAIVWACLMEQKAKDVYLVMKKIENQVAAAEEAQRKAAAAAAAQAATPPPVVPPGAPAAPVEETPHANS